MQRLNESYPNLYRNYFKNMITLGRVIVSTKLDLVTNLQRLGNKIPGFLRKDQILDG